MYVHVHAICINVELCCNILYITVTDIYTTKLEGHHCGFVFFFVFVLLVNILYVLYNVCKQNKNIMCIGIRLTLTL